MRSKALNDFFLIKRIFSKLLNVMQMFVFNIIGGVFVKIVYLELQYPMFFLKTNWCDLKAISFLFLSDLATTYSFYRFIKDHN